MLLFLKDYCFSGHPFIDAIFVYFSMVHRYQPWKRSCRRSSNAAVAHPNAESGLLSHPIRTSSPSPVHIPREMGKKMYVVFKGRQPGIYYTWEECHQQVEGYSSTIFCGYKSASEAFTQWTTFCDVSSHQNTGVSEVAVDYDNMVLTHGPRCAAGCSNDLIRSSRSASYDCRNSDGHETKGDGVEETPHALEALIRIIIGCLIIILAIHLFPCCY
ncbi:uncharacterized protein LOC131239678 [Magnolia sinica]|uniref:uncharacterized protein LOC131239678 n=1 Tax=Magnolia sinica TaxID=86752 RepID=UPI0026594C9A|nr:uncharacterized protein LOC131239678 [Magnolia sinica]